MIKDNNSCHFATCSVIFIKSRLINISNIMVLTQHSKDNEPASKRKKKTRSPAVVAPSIPLWELWSRNRSDIRSYQETTENTSTMHRCLPWRASWSVLLSDMKALLLLSAAVALTVQGSCPGCPLQVKLHVQSPYSCFVRLKTSTKSRRL